MTAAKVGDVFGRRTLVRLLDTINSVRYWWTRCECGNEGKVKESKLRRGQATQCCSCGHFPLAVKNSFKGRRKDHPLYSCWREMRKRCTKPSHPHYENYGGRGIRVCERWSDFANFVADMGPRPEGTSIDRIDNDGGYEPANCRWATALEQGNNQRTNRRVTFNGETLIVAEWSRRLGVNDSLISRRLKKGWPLEKVLRQPSERRSQPAKGK